MKPEDFDIFATLVKQRSGLLLTAEKAYLLDSRLLPVARKHNLKSLEDMARQLRAKREESLLYDITEAMTTNESFFFRDRNPFALFRDRLLPHYIATRAAQKQIRIWSAATSSGQEAYSLAMLCAEQASNLQGWQIEIVGTDLSRDMIARAKAGIYSQFEVQRGLPIRMLVKYFQQIAGDKWQINDRIRQMVQFREGNLLADFGAIGAFDIVYCRNVLIYFDRPTAARVLDAIAAVMPPDGTLVLGSTENAGELSDKFKPMPGENGLYMMAASPENIGGRPLAKTAG